MPKPGVGLNEAIADHAVRDKDWDYADLMALAYQTYTAANKALHKGELPEALIGIDESATVPKMGNYQWGGDDLRLKYHFTLRHDLDQVEVLVAVLACAVHVQAEVYDIESNWHDAAIFSSAMSKYGVSVDGERAEVTSVDTELLNGVSKKMGLAPPRAGMSPSKVAASIDEADLLPVKKVAEPAKTIETIESKFWDTTLTTGTAAT